MQYQLDKAMNRVKSIPLIYALIGILSRMVAYIDWPKLLSAHMVLRAAAAATFDDGRSSKGGGLPHVRRVVRCL